jgi:hypothetical protein
MREQSNMDKVTKEDIFNKFLAPDMSGAVAELEDFWSRLTPALPKIPIPQWHRWLRCHNGNTAPIRFGLKCASERSRHDQFNDPTHHISYVSARANAYRAERDAATARKRAA